MNQQLPVQQVQLTAEQQVTNIQQQLAVINSDLLDAQDRVSQLKEQRDAVRNALQGVQLGLQVAAEQAEAEAKKVDEEVPGLPVPEEPEVEDVEVPFAVRKVLDERPSGYRMLNSLEVIKEDDLVEDLNDGDSKYVFLGDGTKYDILIGRTEDSCYDDGISYTDYAYAVYRKSDTEEGDAY